MIAAKQLTCPKCGTVIDRKVRIAHEDGMCEFALKCELCDWGTTEDKWSEILDVIAVQLELLKSQKFSDIKKTDLSVVARDLSEHNDVLRNFP